MYVAAYENQLEVVMLLIAAGAEVDKASDTGATPLHIATDRGFAGVASALIAAGADVNKARGDGITPLYVAAHENHLEVVKLLIAAGADVNKAGYTSAL